LKHITIEISHSSHYTNSENYIHFSQKPTYKSAKSAKIA
jgi:hypothetical protein